MVVRALLISVAFSAVLAAQGSGVIFGNVTDSSGSAVPSAAITLTNEATQISESVKSNEQGYYLFPDVRAGNYRLAAEAQGFRTAEKTGVLLQVDQRARVDLSMQVGEVKEVVAVEATVTNVDTFSSTVKDVVDSNRMTELPLNGRNALSLQALLPGSIQMGQGSAATFIALNTNLVFSVNGARPSESAYSLDGGLNMDTYNNVPAAFPDPDSLQEFSMLQNSYSAVYGRNVGVVVNMITKSGTNEFHGTLYEFLRNQYFDARNFFSGSVNPLKRNQFGGSVGGPLRLPHYNGKDRTFFFLSTEVTRQVLGSTTSSTIVPTALERSGNFSQSFVRGNRITVAPANTVTASTPAGTPFPGAIIPPSMLDPVAVNFINAFMPPPNRPGNIYSFNQSLPTDESQVVAKVDHSFSNSDKLSARLFWDDSYTELNAGLPAMNSGNDWPTENGTLNETHIFTPSLVNAATLTIARNTFIRAPLATNPGTWADLGCRSCVSLAPPSVHTDWAVAVQNGLGLRVPTNFFSYMMNYQFIDTLSWTKNKHLLQFGGDIAKLRRNGREYFQVTADYSFSGTLTGPYGYGYADFMEGAANNVFQNSPLTSYQYKYTPFLYFQDDWRATKKLTLNLGIRWEPYITTRDALNHDAAFRAGQQSVVYPLAPTGLVFPGDPGIEKGVSPDGFLKLSPRFGFAYDPFGNGKTSIRGGYGVFRNALRLVALNNNALDQPFSYGLTTFSVELSDPYKNNPDALRLLQTYQAAASPNGSKTQVFYPPVSVASVDSNFTSAYTEQWNFNVQREVWRKLVITAGYLGTKGTRLPIMEQINPAIYIPGQSTTGNVNSRRIYQNFQGISSILAAGNSTYHSLQVNWNRRFENGITLLGSYVYAKAIDLVGIDNSQSSDPFNWSKAKGPADFDVRSRFVTSFIYAFPFFKNGSALGKAILGGWQLNGILTLQTGAPFSVLAGVDRSLAGVGLDHADVFGPVAVYNDRARNSKVADYFNTTVFGLPAPGTFGTSGRNILHGPGIQNFDTSLFKQVHLNERSRFELRWELFNSLNRPNFLNPNASFSSAAFGRLTSARDPRIMQVAAKFYF